MCVCVCCSVVPCSMLLLIPDQCGRFDQAFRCFMGFAHVSLAQWEPNISNRRIDPLDATTRVQSEAAVIEHNDSETGPPPVGGEGVVRNRLRRDERWANYPHRRQLVPAGEEQRHLEFGPRKEADPGILDRFLSTPDLTRCRFTVPRESRAHVPEIHPISRLTCNFMTSNSKHSLFVFT